MFKEFKEKNANGCQHQKIEDNKWEHWVQVSDRVTVILVLSESSPSFLAPLPSILNNIIIKFQIVGSLILFQYLEKPERKIKDTQYSNLLQ